MEDRESQLAEKRTFDMPVILEGGWSGGRHWSDAGDTVRDLLGNHYPPKTVNISRVEEKKSHVSPIEYLSRWRLSVGPAGHDKTTENCNINIGRAFSISSGM